MKEGEDSAALGSSVLFCSVVEFVEFDVLHKTLLMWRKEMSRIRPLPHRSHTQEMKTAEARFLKMVISIYPEMSLCTSLKGFINSSGFHRV